MEMINNAERECFVLGKGFMKGDKIVSRFEPIIICKTIIENLTNHDITTSYDIAIRNSSGEMSETQTVNDFTKIRWYRDFSVYDGEMTEADKKLLINKLQRESLASDIETRYEYIGSPGFYKKEGVPFMIMADEIIIPKDKNNISVSSTSECRVKKGEMVFVEKVAEKYIDFMPGVSEILFYGSLLSAIQPILLSMNIPRGFLLVIVAPSGHLKTTLARCYGKWLEEEDSLEISFDDTVRSDVLSRRLESFTTQNYLVDDFHIKCGGYNKTKFKDRLDILTRIASGVKNTAGIIITAESIKGSGIFSGQDRLLQLRIPKMDDDVLEEYKNKLSQFSDYEMSEIAQRFVKKIIDDFDNAESMINNFIEKYKMPDYCKSSTRLGRHTMLVALTEHLFCHYIFKDDSELSRRNSLYEALERNGILQTKQLIKLRSEEQKSSYIIELYEMFEARESCEDIKFITDASKYHDTGNDQALYDKVENRLLITSNALQTALMKRLKVPVSIKKVSDELHDSGILIEDLDKRSIKYRSRRHYSIDVDMLKRVYDSMKYNMLEDFD